VVHERGQQPDRPHHDAPRSPTPPATSIRPFGITAGPDGNVWFTDFRSNVVGLITTAGAITTFADPDGNLDGLGEIALGPDGALWFTSTNSNRIGRIATIGPQPAPPEPVVVAPRFTG
jgi:streptogramin lyase